MCAVLFAEVACRCRSSNLRGFEACRLCFPMLRLPVPTSQLKRGTRKLAGVENSMRHNQKNIIRSGEQAC